MARILVVDDELPIRTLFKIELQAEGHEVFLAEDGEEALEVLAREPIDLITLDIRMPRMDGFDFLGKVRATDQTIPIVICTAYGTHKQDLAVWGADEYVVKSGDLTELKEKIYQLLEKQHATATDDV